MRRLSHCADCVPFHSSLFPIPLAFEATGIVAALIAMIIVALATIYTVELLMAQAAATGMHDYSTLSLAVGGLRYKVRATHMASVSVCALSMVQHVFPPRACGTHAFKKHAFQGLIHQGISVAHRMDMKQPLAKL